MKKVLNGNSKCKSFFKLSSYTNKRMLRYTNLTFLQLKSVFSLTNQMILHTIIVLRLWLHLFVSWLSNVRVCLQFGISDWCV